MRLCWDIYPEWREEVVHEREMACKLGVGIRIRACERQEAPALVAMLVPAHDPAADGEKVGEG